MDESLRQWREDTPGCRERVHLNNAGAALMPRSVIEARRSYHDREALFGGYEAADDGAEAIEGSYESLGRLLGAKAANVAIVENATVAFFQALSAIPWEPGDVIATTRNDYISNQLSFLSLAQRFEVGVRRAADLPEGGVDPDSVREILRDRRVRLLAVTWVPTNSGLVQPAHALGEIAEAAGVPYLLDACQAVGQLEVDVASLRCDYLSATARKFLRGPRGIGFLFASDRALARGDHPLFIDMRGARWESADRFVPVPGARRFENWEFDYGAVLGLGAAARYALEVGISRGGERARALAARVRSRFIGRPGFRVLDRGRELAALATLEVEGWDARAVVARLRDHGINTSASLHEVAVIDMEEKHVRSALRISPHYYNTEDEVESFIAALESISASPGIRGALGVL